MLLFTHYMIFFKYVNNYQSSGYRSNNRFKNFLLSWCSILIEWGILWTTTLYLINVYIDPDVLNKDEAAHNIKTQPCILCSSLRREKSELVVLMDYKSFTYITRLVPSTTSEWFYQSELRTVRKASKWVRALLLEYHPTIFWSSTRASPQVNSSSVSTFRNVFSVHRCWPSGRHI